MNSTMKKKSKFRGSSDGYIYGDGASRVGNKTFNHDCIFYDSPSAGYLIRFKQSSGAMTDTLKELYSKKSQETVDTYHVGDDAGKVSPRIRERLLVLMEGFGFNKSYFAQILGVSRRALYDWLDGKTNRIRKDNLNKIEWLEEVLNLTPTNMQRNFGIWKERKILDSRITLEDILIDADRPALDVVDLLTEYNRQQSALPKIGAWGNKKNAPLPEISAAYSNNDD